jgi:hypothetical protein
VTDFLSTLAVFGLDELRSRSSGRRRRSSSDRGSGSPTPISSSARSRPFRRRPWSPGTGVTTSALRALGSRNLPRHLAARASRKQCSPGIALRIRTRALHSRRGLAAVRPAEGHLGPRPALLRAYRLPPGGKTNTRSRHGRSRWAISRTVHSLTDRDLWEIPMPPKGVKSPKRKRQYEHIKQSARKRGKSPRRAKEIAARTVNKQRRKSGQTENQSSR